MADAKDKGRTFIITFKGINYRADVVCNGHTVATKVDIVGTFRYFSLDITSYVTYGSSAINIIELVIIPPVNSPWDATTTDLAMTFVDWSPPPPDANLVLYSPLPSHHALRSESPTSIGSMA
jgi:hypothetical protein